MPARPELIHPNESSTEAAMERSLEALAAVFQAVGPGEHTLSIALQRTDGVQLSHPADLSLATNPMRMAVLDPDDYYTLAMLLVFALEGSTVESAVLIATTAAEPRPGAFGWTVRGGWLHPMDTADVQAAFIPCPGSSAVDREVYPAPVLIRPSSIEEEDGCV
ncbi:hypothetical protein OG613_47005 (plasmid) [Streptomyces sp. NBC_00015]|uniref:hypothetical protein n=1 Tax=Streptomyces sp. NBC_00015 TaxID=2903611 RepID=UPI002F910FAE